MFRQVTRPLAWLLALTLALCATPVFAQTTTETVTARSQAARYVVTVVDSESNAPVPNARVTVSGPHTYTARTNAAGIATIDAQPGLYDITVAAAGYNGTTLAGNAVVGGSTSNVAVQLQRVSFSSLKTIGHVYVGRNGKFNSSTASMTSVDSSTMIDRGEVQVGHLLNQIPGVINDDGYEVNSAAPGAYTAPQIRGGLPYETESLIDGHPIALAYSGSYNAAFLTAYMLQNVEVAKGPGVFADTLTGAINGTVNYRTLSPTHDPHESFDFGFDGYGGALFNTRATGTFGKLGYAFDYAADGTPGPLNNAPAGSAYLPNYGTSLLINGQPVCGPNGSAGCPVSYGAGDPNYQGSYTISSPLAVCCVQDSTAFFVRNMLGKLSYNFSPTTSLTISDLNLQNRDLGGFGGLENYQTFATFDPPAGYTGSVPAHTSQPFPLTVSGAFLPYRRYVSENFVQGDVRTSIGKTTILARAYGDAINETQLLAPGGKDATFTANLWGAIPLGNPPVLTYFNGQSATITEVNMSDNLFDREAAYGQTIDVSRPIGAGTYAISYDRNFSNGFEAVYGGAWPGIYIPQGSSQRVDTLAARAFVELTPKITLNAGEYFIGYSDHYSPDGGKSFTNASSRFALPRAALTWRPNYNTSIRASAGGSMAPPYLSLITTPGGPPLPNNYAAPSYYTQSIASGSVKPETAFGYDVGVDQRLADGAIVSVDGYLTNLRDQYLQEIYPNGTYQGKPLYDQTTANLGNARYEGVEVSLRNQPTLGFGYLVQGALTRAYPYGIDPSLYWTPAGANTTNLGIIPNVNYVGSGNGYNSPGGYWGGAIPYSTGYGEISYRATHGRFARLGMTYFGKNNQFNQPAFEVFSASVGTDVGKVSVLLGADNIFNNHSLPYLSEFTGVPVPLVNGKLGATFGGTYGPPTLNLTVHVPVR